MVAPHGPWLAMVVSELPPGACLVEVFNRSDVNNTQWMELSFRLGLCYTPFVGRVCNVLCFVHCVVGTHVSKKNPSYVADLEVKLFLVGVQIIAPRPKFNIGASVTRGENEREQGWMKSGRNAKCTFLLFFFVVGIARKPQDLSPQIRIQIRGSGGEHQNPGTLTLLFCAVRHSSTVVGGQGCAWGCGVGRCLCTLPCFAGCRRQRRGWSPTTPGSSRPSPRVSTAPVACARFGGIHTVRTKIAEKFQEKAMGSHPDFPAAFPRKFSPGYLSHVFQMCRLRGGLPSHKQKSEGILDHRHCPSAKWGKLQRCGQKKQPPPLWSPHNADLCAV